MHARAPVVKSGVGSTGGRLESRRGPGAQLERLAGEEAAAAWRWPLPTASQLAGLRAALAELGHLDPDTARVGPVDVDGLSFRGVFRLLAGDLDQAVTT